MDCLRRTLQKSKENVPQALQRHTLLIRHCSVYECG